MHQQKAKDANSKATDKEDKVERGVDEDNEGEDGEGQGEGQEGDEGKGQRGKAEIAAALAAQVPVKEKDGNPRVAGDTVMRDTLKNNDKYDKRKAKVQRLNVRAVVVTILEGPAPGEKRKVDYKALEVWPCSSPTEDNLQAAFL